MDVRESWRRIRCCRRVCVVGDIGVVSALNLSPSHGLLVTVGVIGDDVEVDSVHIIGRNDGAHVGFAVEGFQDRSVNG